MPCHWGHHLGLRRLGVCPCRHASLVFLRLSLCLGASCAKASAFASSNEAEQSPAKRVRQARQHVYDPDSKAAETNPKLNNAGISHNISQPVALVDVLCDVLYLSFSVSAFILSPLGASATVHGLFGTVHAIYKAHAFFLIGDSDHGVLFRGAQ